MTNAPLKSLTDLSAAELEACMSSLRQLALALVRDDATAEDLVQEAMGAAIQHPTPVRHVLSYMKGVVRTLALRQRRIERRREHRERDHARPETLPSDDELADRVELMQSVLHALESLPDAQRRAVSLRYLDGVQAADIARSEGKSPATVRALVSRGLARLRAQLDAQHRDRASWSALIVSFPVARDRAAAFESLTSLASRSASASIGFTGLFSMSTSTKLAVALVPLVTLGTWFTFQQMQTRTDPVEEGVSGSVEGPASLRDEGTPVADAPAEPRRAAARDATDAVPDGATHSVPEGEVVDALTGDRLPFVRFQLAGEATETAPVEMETDKEGRFRGDVSLPHGDVEFVHLGREESHVLGPSSERVQSLTFPLAGPIEVRVGPTFFFTPHPPDDLAPEIFTVELTAPSTSSRFRLAAPLHDGQHMWTRFEFHHLLPHLEGPLRLSVTDDAGYWRAEVAAPRALGVEPTPLVLSFTQTGAVRFRLEAPFTNEMLLQSVELRSKDGEGTRHTWLRNESGAS